MAWLILQTCNLCSFSVVNIMGKKRKGQSLSSDVLRSACLQGEQRWSQNVEGGRLDYILAYKWLRNFCGVLVSYVDAACRRQRGNLV